jgi:hypothetical protein
MKLGWIEFYGMTFQLSPNDLFILTFFFFPLRTLRWQRSPYNFYQSVHVQCSQYIAFVFPYFRGVLYRKYTFVYPRPNPRNTHAQRHVCLTNRSKQGVRKAGERNGRPGAPRRRRLLVPQRIRLGD